MSPKPTHEHLFLPVGAPLWQEVRCPCGLHRSLVASVFVYRLAGKTYDVPPKCEGPRPMRVHADKERETTAQRWRKLGLCVSCGDKVTTTATTGEPSIYCQTHLVRPSRRLHAIPPPSTSPQLELAAPPSEPTPPIPGATWNPLALEWEAP